MRALITGASGFAGGWLCRECAAAGDEVVGLSRRGSIPDGCGEGIAVDLRDGGAVRDAVAAARPDVVFHLAALTSVGRSWEEPEVTLRDNLAGAVSLLQALRFSESHAGVVWVSSCEVYGAHPELPAREDGPLAPANPYAVSKLAGEQLAQVYADAYGLRLVIARPFSHSGPGQLPIYLLSNITRQAAQGRRDGADTLRVVTGNPETRRDFTDVRDVARAYRMLAERLLAGETGVAGQAYNVSSGRSVSASDQVSLLGELITPIAVEHVVDPALVRAHEVMDLRGDHSRLTELTGWEPRIPLRQTMADALAFWDAELRAA